MLSILAFPKFAQAQGNPSSWDFSFEAPALAPEGWQPDPTGIPWTFTGSTSGICANGGAVTNGNPNAPDGVQVACLTSTDQFSQSLSLTAGTYVLTFYAAQRSYGGSLEQENFNVTIDGNVVGQCCPTSGSYSVFSTRSFTVADGSHTLAFVGVDTIGGENTALIDDLSLNPAASIAAPASLTATAGNQQVSLSWSSVSGATSYNVYRSLTSGGAYSLIGSSTAASYTDTGLTNGTTYYYVVTAVSSAGEGPQSNEASATPQAGSAGWDFSFEAPALAPEGWQPDPTGIPWMFIGSTSGICANGGAVTNGNPNAPDGVQVACLTSTDQFSQSLSLTAGTYVLTFYAAQRSYGGSLEQENFNVTIDGNVVGQCCPTSGSYSVFSTRSFTVADGSHTLAFVGVDTIGGENTALIDDLSLNPAASTAAPASLTATGGNEQVSLSWSSVSGATSYNVYRSLTSGGAYSLVGSSTAANYTDTGLTNGTTYYYVVTALNGGGASGDSNEANATPEPPAPSAPTGLTATAGNAEVSLSWTVSSGATSYDVYRGLWPGGESGTPLATGVTATSYTDSSVSAGIPYYYEITALNSVGPSADSNEASATPEPSAPTNLTATAGDSQVTLSWTASSGAASYNVYRGTSSGGESGAPLAAGVSAPLYEDTSATDGTIYYYDVSALNDGAASAFSNEASATPEAAALAAPTDLTATGGVSQVFLSWTAASGASTYNVYRGTTSGGESGTPLTTGATATSYTDSSVVNGTTYYYELTVVSSGGMESAKSVEAEAEPAASNSQAPEITSVVPGDGQITINWSSVSGADGYMVFLSTNGGSFNSVAQVANISGTSYTFTAYIGRTYAFYVCAGMTEGYGPASAVAGASLSLPAPSGFNLTPGDGQITAAWSPVTGADGYMVYVSVNGGSFNSVQQGANITGTSYTYQAYLGRTYQFEVDAINNGGTSSMSPVESMSLWLAAPQNLTLTQGNYQIFASWSPVASADGYMLYYSMDGGAFNSVQQGALISGTSFTYQSAFIGHSYRFEICAGNNGGYGAMSAIEELTPELAAPVIYGYSDGLGNVYLSWSAVPLADNYTVYRSSTSGEGYSQIGQASTGYYVDSPGISGNPYYYVVQASNEGGSSPNSNQLAIITGNALVVNSSSLTVAPGGNTSCTVSYVYSGTVSGDLSLALDGPTIPGLTDWFYPSSPPIEQPASSMPSRATSTLFFYPSSSVAPGVYNLTVTATVNGSTVSAPLTLTVVSP